MSYKVLDTTDKHTGLHRRYYIRDDVWEQAPLKAINDTFQLTALADVVVDIDEQHILKCRWPIEDLLDRLLIDQKSSEQLFETLTENLWRTAPEMPGLRSSSCSSK